MVMKKQTIKRTRRRLLKPDRVISLLNLDKVKSVDEKTTEPNKICMKPPGAPRNLNARARREWDRMVVELIELGRFQIIDTTALALYCDTYAEWEEAGEQLKKPGISFMMKSKDGKALYRNPWGDIRRSARKEMSTYLALFGMSPHDRARLGMDDKRKPNEAPNPFDEF